MICPVCGTLNEASVRMCPTCGYLLASGPLPAKEARKAVTGAVASGRPVSFLKRLENSKKGIAIILVIVIVVIFASLYLTVRIHINDANLGATLFYRYSSGNSTSGPHVSVWGDVYNWGASSGSGRLTIVITDDEGHKLVDKFKVGPVAPQKSVDVDKVYPWNYLYDPVEHPVPPVDVGYDI